MKKIWTIFAISGLFLSACHKDYVEPSTQVKTMNGGATLPGVSSANPPAANDTTTGYVRVQMAMSTAATDDILIEFNPSATATYSGLRDAKSLPGFGQLSLSSLSSDNIALTINQLPLVSSGTHVGLVVNASATGQYQLNLTAISNTVPAAVEIWLKDAYSKDSLDFRKYPSYAFNINKSDSTTYGNSRFSLVLREK